MALSTLSLDGRQWLAGAILADPCDPRLVSRQIVIRWDEERQFTTYPDIVSSMVKEVEGTIKGSSRNSKDKKCHLLVDNLSNGHLTILDVEDLVVSDGVTIELDLEGLDVHIVAA